jgi:hypothetical protein
VGVELAGIFGILGFHVIISWFALRYRRATQRLLGVMVNPFERVISRVFTSRQHFAAVPSRPITGSTAIPPPARIRANGRRRLR